MFCMDVCVCVCVCMLYACITAHGKRVLLHSRSNKLIAVGVALSPRKTKTCFHTKTQNGRVRTPSAARRRILRTQSRPFCNNYYISLSCFR